MAARKQSLRVLNGAIQQIIDFESTKEKRRKTIAFHEINIQNLPDSDLSRDSKEQSESEKVSTARNEPNQ